MVSAEHVSSFIEFDGARWYRSRAGYFLSGKQTGDFRKGEYLHRYVWSKHNGPIPAKYHIHHRDEDKANNAIENLELVHESEHNKKFHEFAWVRPPRTIKCSRCGSDKTGTATHMRYCSRQCYDAWRNERRIYYVPKPCVTCGTPCMRVKHNKKPPCCSTACRSVWVKSKRMAVPA